MALTKVIGAGIGTVTNQFADGNMAAGSVIQVQNFMIQNGVNSIGAQSISSTSLGATALLKTITPTATSSDIYIRFDLHGIYNNAVAGNATKVAIYRDIGGAGYSALSPLTNGTFADHVGYENGEVANLENASFSVLDSPNTTSEITYRVYIARLVSSGYGRYLANAPDQAIITLMEIAG